MASILIILLVLVFGALIILLSFGTYVLSIMFGGFRNLKNFVCRLLGWDKGKSQTRYAKSSSGRTSSSQNKSKGKSPESSKKVFDQDEGTYIDFEEVK